MNRAKKLKKVLTYFFFAFAAASAAIASAAFASALIDAYEK